ncbi:hypothetical protein [Allorhodopirellula solitaria]|uniref:Uncharacterized protein n=1 Tax=Allorhodopirellula solitaria TaxID=2527987 RepID=A0A5C5X290_9BACT|nr:hypothetical protein [Allorhodopirellula solitaria]TWT56283.1 hypothetical protein CA85_42840 [Allorhodopirellula solitaria]
MNPIELVKRGLSPEEWDAACQFWREPIEPIQEVADECPFARHRLFIVYGRTRQFDFPTLPHGSYGYYAANGRSAIRLTRINKEIQTILADEWADLPASDPVRLASLILKFFDAGIKASHHVLRDANELRNFGKPRHSMKNYQLSEKEFQMAMPHISSTESTLDGKCVALRAVTLCGWMHDKRNLGIESLTIASDGNVSFAKRQVLSRGIFDRVPAIRY